MLVGLLSSGFRSSMLHIVNNVSYGADPPHLADCLEVLAKAIAGLGKALFADLCRDASLLICCRL